MPSTYLLNSPNTEEVSFFDPPDLAKMQLTSQVTLHDDVTATTAIATSRSTTVLNALPLDESLSNAVYFTTEDKTILEVYPSNAHALAKSQPNAETVTTINESTLEENHFNAKTQEKSPISAINVTTDQILTPEKNHFNADTQEISHNNAVSVTTDNDHNLEKDHNNEKMQELNKNCDPNINLVTKQINNLSLDTNPAKAVSEINLTLSSYSPPNLRPINARRSHTSV